MDFITHSNTTFSFAYNFTLWYFKYCYYTLVKFLNVIQKRYLLVLFLTFLLGFLAVTGLGLGILSYKLHDLSDIKQLEDYQLYEVPSVLYDINGKPFKEFALHKREIVSYNEIPKTVIDTLIQAEDKNFFHHRGVNFFGIFRAIVINTLAGKVEQGGSTLTQQLAKLLFTNQERHISRKIKELFYTFQIEKNFTKEEILEKYLNKVYYANGIYSIASAAKFYFGIPLKQINYAQAALLISIPPSPTYYNPLTHPINVKERQQVVMHLLVKAKKITQKEADRETTDMWETIQTKLVNGDYYNNRQQSLDLAPQFSEYVRRILYKKYGDKLYTNGYKIYTTLDIDMQQAAQNSVEARMGNANLYYKQNAQVYYNYIQKNMTTNNTANPRITEFLGVALGMPYLKFYLGELDNKINKQILNKDIYSLNLVFNTFRLNGISGMLRKVIDGKSASNIQIDNLETAIVSTEPSTGRIKVMVGGADYAHANQLNRVYQTQRQPGSVFKPFLYLAALNSARFTAADVFDDKPIAFQLPSGDIWMPGDSERNYSGAVTLRNALVHSLNVVSVRLLQSFGVPQTVNFVSTFLNIAKSRFRQDSSLALGTSELTPLEVNKGYATIANGGKEIFPHAIIEIRNQHNQVIDAPEEKILAKQQQQLDDARYNYIIIDMMKDVMRRGTGATAAGAANFRPGNLAGKTGTASNMTDAWFSGFSPDVATTVWIGFDRRATLGINAFGAVLAEPIWIDIMKVAAEKIPLRDFTRPDGLIQMNINMDNGKLMSPECIGSKETFSEYFTDETRPTQYSTYCGKKIEDDLQKGEEEIKDSDIFNSIKK